MEYCLAEAAFKQPEFGRSVSLTAVDGRLVGDRDGVLTLLGERPRRIENIMTVEGYVVRISGTMVVFENGIFDATKGETVLNRKGIQDGI